MLLESLSLRGDTKSEGHLGQQLIVSDFHLSLPLNRYQLPATLGSLLEIDGFHGTRSHLPHPLCSSHWAPHIKEQVSMQRSVRQDAKVLYSQHSLSTGLSASGHGCSGLDNVRGSSERSWGSYNFGTARQESRITIVEMGRLICGV